MHTVPTHSNVYEFIDPRQYKTPPLQDHTALVTGAGRGIGRTIAMTLAIAGANVICVSRSLAELEALVVEIGGLSTGAVAFAIQEDISLEGAGERIVSRAKQCQRDAGLTVGIDILVNNAAIDRLGPFYLEPRVSPNGPADGGSTESYTWPWWQVLKTNLLGPVQMTHAVLPYMLESNSGTLISIGSRNAGLPFPYMTAYSASKAALLRFHTDLDVELASREGRGTRASGIASFVVQPGNVATSITHTPGAINLQAAVEVDSFREMLEQSRGSCTESPDLVGWTIVKLIVSKDARALLTGRYVNAEQDLGVVLEAAKGGLIDDRALYELKIDEL